MCVVWYICVHEENRCYVKKYEYYFRKFVNVMFLYIVYNILNLTYIESYKYK